MEYFKVYSIPRSTEDPRDIDPERPRLQIIRGPYGTGKTTLARTFPCRLHEIDLYFYRMGAYRWGEAAFKKAKEEFMLDAHRIMKQGCDLVVTGALPLLGGPCGKLVYWGMKCGYETWVCDLTEVMGCGTVHGVRLADRDMVARMFEPFGKEAMAETSRFGKEPGDLSMSAREYAEFKVYVMRNVHVGLMPREYAVIPEIDGMGV